MNPQPAAALVDKPARCAPSPSPPLALAIALPRRLAGVQQPSAIDRCYPVLRTDGSLLEQYCTLFLFSSPLLTPIKLYTVLWGSTEYPDSGKQAFNTNRLSPLRFPAVRSACLTAGQWKKCACSLMPQRALVS